MRTRPCNEPASAPRAAPMTLERLPRELCGVVFSHLRPADMVVLSMCSRRRCDAFLDDLYWKPRYLAVFPRPRISPSASYHLWQNMYKKRWRERRRARRIEGDTCAMGLRLGNMLGSYAPREMSPPTTAASWMAETPDGANGLSRLSREVELWEEDEEDDRLLIRGPPAPRHGLVTVRDSAHTSRPIRYFVEAHADIGPDRGEMDVSLRLSDESDITCIRVHTSEGVLHDPERPEVGRRRIRVGSPVSELLQAYGLGADDVTYLPSDRFGPTFVLRGVQGLRFGVAGEIEYDEDGNHEKDKLLGERLVSIAVQRGNVHDVLLSMLGY